MAVGATSTFDMTRDSLIRAALRKVGESEPSNQEIADGVQALNLLVRNLDLDGRKIWATSQTESTLTLVAGQRAYVTGSGASNIATNIAELIWAAVLVGNDYEDLTIYDDRSAMRTSQKSYTNARPVACFLEQSKLRADNRFLVYPTPNSAYTIKYTYRRSLNDFTQASDNPDFPSGIAKPLVWLLAADLAPEYSVPLDRISFLEGKGSALLEKALADLAPKPSYVRHRGEYF